MIRINIAEAKTSLSKYLARLERGETILLCRRNVPIAEIRGIRPEDSKPRPFGLARGLFDVPADFDEPLPESEISAWEGG